MPTKLPLPDELEDAMLEARNIAGFGARRRQTQFARALATGFRAANGLNVHPPENLAGLAVTVRSVRIADRQDN
jgi:ribosomal 50S subunit-associated protein YjgA (DUF615 family)